MDFPVERAPSAAVSRAYFISRARRSFPYGWGHGLAATHPLAAALVPPLHRGPLCLGRHFQPLTALVIDIKPPEPCCSYSCETNFVQVSSSVAGGCGLSSGPMLDSLGKRLDPSSLIRINMGG